jgi:putative ABC transport system ATP-binding protein
MININSICFSYGNNGFELTIPEFSVEKGEKVALIGTSGSGKTTLLNLIAGIICPLEGYIEVNDIQVTALGDDARRDYRISNIGFVFQDFQLLDYLNVLDNILHPFRITTALSLSKIVRHRAAQLAQQMNIADKLRRRPDDLSQGEKQRAAICRALLPQPKVILADEATGNLDPANKMHILDLLFEMVEQHDATLLAVTHDHELLSRFDRVVDFANFENGGIYERQFVHCLEIH